MRLVTFDIAPMNEERYRRLVVEHVEPVNRAFGCSAVYSLRERGEANRYAIVSVWSDERRLSAMRSSEQYRVVLQALRDLIDGDLNDRLFQSLVDVR